MGEVKEALSGLQIDGACGLPQLVRALREAPQSAFSANDIQSIAAGISALERPLDARPVWASNKSRGHFFVFEGLDRSGSRRKARSSRNSWSGKVLCVGHVFRIARLPLAC